MTSTALPMTFADRGGQLVHIDEVPNGLACGCACAGCGERLVAKQGPQTVHHFAHESGGDCAGGLQTALHRAAKAVLSRERRMRLPKLLVVEEAKDGMGRKYPASRSIASRTVDFNEVIEESRFGSVVPDIHAKIGDWTLLVEVAVHHFVDEVKLAKLREAGVACVEVDLSGMLGGWNWASLRDVLVDGLKGKAWIYNPRESALRMAARCEAEALAAKASIRELNLNTEIESAHARPRADIPHINAALDKLEELRHPQRRARERERLAATGHLEPAWISAARSLGISWESPPPFVGIAVPGETAFLVDSRVWQAALFVFFIKDAQAQSFEGKTAAKWCSHRFPRRTEFYLLQRHESLLTREQAADQPWASRAVNAYLKELTKLGFLRHIDDRFEIADAQGGLHAHCPRSSRS